MTDNSVLLEKRGQAFWITINRPEKRPAGSEYRRVPDADGQIARLTSSAQLSLGELAN
jgi:hypothetical protein